MSQPMLKRTALGSGSFAVVRSGKYVYADKTEYIEKLENFDSLFPFIVRPRRFGKTLFADMLCAYYDKAAANDFDRRFKGTYIYDHPTPLRNAYYVLELDFSAMDACRIEQAVIDRLIYCMGDFFLRYPIAGSDDFLALNFQTPAEVLEKFFSFIQKHVGRQSVFIIIDEYDQFANEILSADKAQFRLPTSTKGFLKNLYGAIKLQTRHLVARVFITGVTSIAIDSMTSGFSIAENLTFNSEFSEMLGFTDREVRALISEMADFTRLQVSADDIFARMKDLYNGYRFNKRCENTVFNASMCLYYLKSLCTSGYEPEPLMDPSFSQDLSKIHGILSLADDRTLIREIVDDAIKGRPIAFAGPDRPVLNLNAKGKFGRNELLCALIYFGFLTFQYGSGDLVCPNRVVKQLFLQYYFEYLLKAGDFDVALQKLDREFSELRKGQPEAFVRAVFARLYKAMGVHDAAHFTESCACYSLLTALIFSSDYRCSSELETREDGRGIADLVLEPRSRDDTAYIFEAKHITKTGATAQALQDAVLSAEEAATAQLERYRQDPRFAQYPSLATVVIVFVGTELRVVKTAHFAQ